MCRSTKNKIEAYGGFPVKTMGIIVMTTETKEVIDPIDFVVISGIFRQFWV